jgi:hypothetical protein
MRPRGYWRWMAEQSTGKTGEPGQGPVRQLEPAQQSWALQSHQRARQRMQKIIDDICSEAEMIDMLKHREDQLRWSGPGASNGA